MQRDASNLDIDAICSVLARFGVEFVVVGGAAAVYQGSDLLTSDFDCVPGRTDDNLWKLTSALRDLDAQVSFVGPLPRFVDGEWLKSSRMWNFETRLGPIDVLFAPAGAPGYESLVREATPRVLDDGTEVRVASLEHLIAMKQAAGRPKDLLAIPILQYLKDRRDNPLSED